MFPAIVKIILNSGYYTFAFLYHLISLLHTVLPYGLDVGLVGVSAYFLTRLKKPEINNVISIFGPEPWSKESELHPEKTVSCIAHRGAALDAPENTIAAFKYVSKTFFVLYMWPVYL